MKKAFLISTFLVLSNFLFGQYVDTLKFSRIGGGFSSSSMDKVIHGQTEVKEKNKGECVEIHRSTFDRHLQSTHSYYFPDENTQPITLILREGDFMAEENFFSLADSFQNGIDSVFKEYPKTGNPQYLHKVVELFDRRGTARITNYYSNGNTKSILNYTADTSDFDVLAVAMIENGDTFGLGENYRKEEFLKDSKNLKNTIGIFDTTFILTGFIHNEEKHFHKNGKLSYEGFVHYNYADSICKSYYENGQIAMEQYYDKGQQDGKVRAWYENGKLKGYNYYDKDKPIGTWQEWDENGQLIKESTFKNFKMRSRRFLENEVITIHKTKEWYSNGRLKKVEKVFSESKLGKYIEYYENGQLKEKGKYANPISVMAYIIFWLNNPEYFRQLDKDIRKGIKNGKWKYYTENGDLLIEQKYRFGLLRKEKKYADELVIFDYFNPPAEEHCRSQLIVKVDISDTEFEEKVYCINRKEIAWIDTFYNYVVNDSGDSTKYIFEIVDFLDKRGTMNYQRFYPNGQMMANYNYKASERSSFDEPLKDGWRRNGHNEVTGQSTFWYENGNVKWEIDHGEYYWHFKKRTKYYENGQKQSETYGYYEEDVVWKEWYENGQLKEQIGYGGSDKNGAYLKWNEKGVLLEKLNYKDDKLDGEQFYYNENGELVEIKVYEAGVLMEIKTN